MAFLPCVGFVGVRVNFYNSLLLPLSCSDISRSVREAEENFVVFQRPFGYKEIAPWHFVRYLFYWDKHFLHPIFLHHLILNVSNYHCPHRLVVWLIQKLEWLALQ